MTRGIPFDDEISLHHASEPVDLLLEMRIEY